MGKHGRVAGRKQVPIPAVVLAVLLLAGVVTGSWWWSLRTQFDPIDQNPVAAAAFVLSSPSCADHGTGTVVDVLPASGGQATAVVDGCGYSDREQVAVEYLAGDPSQARLAGTRSPSTSDHAEQWWPVVLGILALLATGIVVVLVMDGGRFRRRGAPSPSPDGPVPDVQDPIAAVTAMVSTTADLGAPSLVAVDGQPRAGRHARLELDDQQPAEEWPGDGLVPNANRDGWLLEPAQPWAAEISVGGDGQPPPDDAPLPPRLDLVFPSTAELAASLHDELFTHRQAQFSGG